MAKNSQLIVDIGKGFALAIGLPSIASWNINTRPKNPKRGTFGFNMETQSLEFYNGQIWYHAAMKAN